MFILKKGHQPGVYVPLRALFLVFNVIFSGLAFRPIPNVMTTLIRFNKARPSTYSPYVDHIEGFLQCKFYSVHNI